MKLLEMACYQWILKSEKTERAKMHDTSFQYLNKLADISISLSSEDDLLTLLRKILEEGQNIACCDAASPNTACFGLQISDVTRASISGGACAPCEIHSWIAR